MCSCCLCDGENFDPARDVAFKCTSDPCMLGKNVSGSMSCVLQPYRCIYFPCGGWREGFTAVLGIQPDKNNTDVIGKRSANNRTFHCLQLNSEAGLSYWYV